MGILNPTKRVGCPVMGDREVLEESLQVGGEETRGHAG